MPKPPTCAAIWRKLPEWVWKGISASGYSKEAFPTLEIDWAQKRDGFEIHIEQTQDTYRFDLSVEVRIGVRRRIRGNGDDSGRRDGSVRWSTGLETR